MSIKINKENEAKILTFSRKFNTTSCKLFSSESASGEAIPLSCEVKQGLGVNGTIASKKEEKNITDRIKKGNPWIKDTCFLPVDHKYLHAHFDFVVCRGELKAHATSNADFASRIEDFAVKFMDNQEALTEVCQKYILNIVTGRWLFRNLTLARSIRVLVDGIEFNPTPLCHDLNELSDADRENLAILTEKLAATLKCGDYLSLSVKAQLELELGQEVFPSQEFNDKGTHKYVTARSGQIDQAIITPQKINNAIRTIDDWYGEGGIAQPIAVEVYGYLKTKQEVQRPYESDKNLYAIMNNVDKLAEDTSNNDAKFLFASLLRGGMYSNQAGS